MKTFKRKHNDLLVRNNRRDVALQNIIVDRLKWSQRRGAATSLQNIYYPKIPK